MKTISSVVEHYIKTKPFLLSALSQGIINLYNELSTIKSEEKLKVFEQKLIDRFGALPKEAQALLTSMRIKWLATKMGVEKLVLKQGKMLGYFLSDQQSAYYQSGAFHKVLQFVQKNPALIRMKEKQTKNGLRLLITFENVKSVKKAKELLEMVFE